MKRSNTIGLIILLYAAISMAIPLPHAEADVKVTISFAAGGAACGAYFLFIFSSDLTGNLTDKQSEAVALFNHNSVGWQVSPPSLQFQEDHQKGYLPYADIIRIRF